MQYLFPSILVLMPLLFAPGALVHFNTTPKIALLLFSIPALFIFCKKDVTSLYIHRETCLFAVLLGAQWTLGGLSAWLSTSPVLSLEGSAWRRMGWVTESGLAAFALLAIAGLATERRRTAALRAMAAAGALAALYGTAQYFGYDPFILPASYQAGEGIFRITRPPGTIGHADYFACWLLMTWFPALALLRTEPRRAARIASGAACAAIGLAILLTGTRGAWIGLLCGLACLWAMNGFRASRRAWTATVVAVSMLIAFAVSPAGQAFRARLHWAKDDAGGGARLLLWRDSLAMALDRPWVGFGAETFASRFPRYASLGLARAYPDFYQESPHNFLLDTLASNGIPAVLSLAGLIALGLVSGWRARRNAEAQAVLAGLAAALVSLQFTVFVAATALYFYVTIAMLASFRVGQPKAARPPRVYWIFFAASLCLPVFAVRLLASDRALMRVERSIAANDADGAAAAYLQARRWLPPGEDLPYSRAMFALAQRPLPPPVRAKAWAEARDAAIRATGTAEDRQNAWYNLAGIYAAENNAGAAESSLRNAIACAPNWFKPHWTLANLLALTGRAGEAGIEAAAAVERDAGRHREVSDTLAALPASAP